MKKILAIAIFMMALVHNAGAEEITLKFNCGDIKSLKQGSSDSVTFEYFVTKGDSESVTVIYDSELEKAFNGFEESLDISYSNGNLTVGMKESARRWIRFRSSNHKPVKVYFEMDEISGLDLSGASVVYFTGEYTSNNLEIEMSGASKFAGPLNIKGNSMELDCSGAAKVSVHGDFENISIDASGASNINFSGNSVNLEGDFSGASKLYLDGSDNRTDIECSGATDLEMNGEGKILILEASGACKIDAKGYKVRNATVELSGASSAKLAVSDELKYNVSTASKLTYFGNPKMTNLSTHQNVVQGSH